MNERIQELSKQAEKYTDDNFRGETTWSEAFESKFAELIVQECAGVCENSNYEFGTIFTKMIKQHFGVAEREE